MSCKELVSMILCSETQLFRLGTAGLPYEIELFIKPTIIPRTCAVKYLDITRSIYHKLKNHNKWIYIINTMDNVTVTCNQGDNVGNIQLTGVGIITIKKTL